MSYHHCLVIWLLCDSYFVALIILLEWSSKLYPFDHFLDLKLRISRNYRNLEQYILWLLEHILCDYFLMVVLCCVPYLLKCLCITLILVSLMVRMTFQFVNGKWKEFCTIKGVKSIDYSFSTTVNEH